MSFFIFCHLFFYANKYLNSTSGYDRGEVSCHDMSQAMNGDKLERLGGGLSCICILSPRYVFFSLFFLAILMFI